MDEAETVAGRVWGGREEPVTRWAVTAELDGDLLAYGPVLTETLDRLRERLERELAERHLVMVGRSGVRWDQDHDPVRDRMQVMVSAHVIRDPEWVDAILASARQAVDQDQAFLAGESDGR